jgi:hypothetical protein
MTFDTLPSAAEVHPKPTTKTGLKQEAQDILMHGLATAMGYWTEQHVLLANQMTEAEQLEFGRILLQQADRVAHLFGYEQAWTA